MSCVILTHDLKQGTYIGTSAKDVETDDDEQVVYQGFCNAPIVRPFQSARVEYHVRHSPKYESRKTPGQDAIQMVKDKTHPNHPSTNMYCQ